MKLIFRRGFLVNAEVGIPFGIVERLHTDVGKLQRNDEFRCAFAVFKSVITQIRNVIRQRNACKRTAALKCSVPDRRNIIGKIYGR